MQDERRKLGAKITKSDIAALAELLGLPVSDERLIAFVGPLVSKIRTDAYYGFLRLPRDGVDVVFQRAPWVVPQELIVNKRALHLAAFHFHREGHERYAGYTGELPKGVAFGDAEFEVRRKMGKPFATGGGGVTSFPKMLIPRWLKYQIGSVLLHYQLDADGLMEMVTLMTPEVRPKAK